MSIRTLMLSMRKKEDGMELLTLRRRVQEKVRDVVKRHHMDDHLDPDLVRRAQRGSLA